MKDRNLLQDSEFTTGKWAQELISKHFILIVFVSTVILHLSPPLTSMHIYKTSHSSVTFFFPATKLTKIYTIFWSICMIAANVAMISKYYGRIFGCGLYSHSQPFFITWLYFGILILSAVTFLKFYYTVGYWEGK